MWQGLDLIPHAPTFVEGEKYHPEAIAALHALGRAYVEAELGGVLMVTPDFYDDNAFPVNPADPLHEQQDYTGFIGLSAVEERRWDGLPFLADSIQRSARQHGVPAALRPGPISHGIWAPLRHMFPQMPMPVLPVGLSGLSVRNHVRFGRAIRDAVVDAPKPIAVLVSANLTHRPDLLRWDKSELLPEGRNVDRTLLKVLTDGDWARYDALDQELLRAAQPDGGPQLWGLLRGLTEGLRGEQRYYGPALGAFGMALVHFDTETRDAA